MNGQINTETEFGKALVNIAMDPENKHFLDIGTWNGNGSTYCLVLGINMRGFSDNVKLVSVETNKFMLEEATKNYRDQKDDTKFLELKWGRIAESMMSLEEIRAHPKFNDVNTHFNLYYETDLKDFMAAPLIKPIENLDVVVIDGGEFCGMADWLAVEKYKPRIVALDDTNVMKTCDVMTLLKNSKEYEVLQEGSERNGYCIFRRV